MANNKTSIEIEAKGEFSQLTQGLRQVKSALSDVTSVVNRGAKSGGIFDAKQIKALDVFSNRFKDSMKSMTSLIDEQAEKITQLYNRRRTASQQDVAALDKEIKKQGQKLDQLEQERRELERIYQLRRQEASQFQVLANQRRSMGGSSGGYDSAGNETSGGNGGSDNGSAGMLGSILGSAKGVLGKLAAVAGVSIGISQLLQWEQMAEQNVALWQNLQQRGIRQGPLQNLGLSYGYNSNQTGAMADIFSSMSGRANTGDLAGIVRGARAYGVDPNTLAAITGQYAQYGFGGPSSVMAQAAGSTPSSMQGRVLEVLEAQLGFLQSMDKSLQDNNGNTLLAYTARLNQIGVANNAQRLTGASGASLLEQMGNNIFNPSNPTWMAMGMNMLSRFGGASTSGMDTFGLMSTWQQGFGNAANVSAMAKYLDSSTSGMSGRQGQEFKALFLQQAMGGNTTLGQAMQFGQMTNWLHSFDQNDPKMKALLNGVGAPGTVNAKANQWQTTLAAKIEITNAKWMQAELEAGKLVIPTVLDVKSTATNLLNGATGHGTSADAAMAHMIEVGAGLYLANKALKGVGNRAEQAGRATGKRLVDRIQKGKAGKAGGRATAEAADGAGETLLRDAGKTAPDLARSFLVNGATRLLPRMATGLIDGLLSPDLVMAGVLGGIVSYSNSHATPQEIAQKNQNTRYQQYYQRYKKWSYANGPSIASSVGNDPTAMRNLQRQYMGELDNPNAPWNKGLTNLGPIVQKTTDSMKADTKTGMASMVKAADDERKKTIKAAEDTRDKVTSEAKQMHTDVVKTTKDTQNDTSKAWMGMRTDLHNVLAYVLNAGIASTSSMMPAGTGLNTMPASAAQKRVYAELQKQGHGDWWPVVNQLVQRESSWSNLVGATDPKDHQTPYGYFQFKPGTWNSKGIYGGTQWAGNPLAYSPEIQTDAFVRYINQRYHGSMADLIMATGLGGASYKGYADGTFVAHDQPALLHGGEEVISRSKTGQVLRKTGMLPSQVLNQAMRGGSPVVMGGSANRLDLNIHLTADQNVAHVNAQEIMQIARHVFEEAAAQTVRAYPSF